MRKNLQNAMTKNFQKMVNEQPSSTSTNKTASTEKETKKATTSEDNVAPVIDEKPEPQPIPEPVIEEVIPAPVQPEPQPVPVAAPVPTPVDTQPRQPVSTPQTQYAQYVAEPAQSINAQAYNYQQPAAAPTSTPAPTSSYEQEPAKPTRTVKKPIPLMPEEKSSGVLHIRLGELRSYVDFMTQSGKMSYQQYISNLIEQDYEKNKELYLKYKSFMDQLNM